MWLTQGFIIWRHMLCGCPSDCDCRDINNFFYCWAAFVALVQQDITTCRLWFLYINHIMTIMLHLVHSLSFLYMNIHRCALYWRSYIRHATWQLWCRGLLQWKYHKLLVNLTVVSTLCKNGVTTLQRCSRVYTAQEITYVWELSAHAHYTI